MDGQDCEIRRAFGGVPYIVPTPTNGGSPVDAADKRVVYIRDTLLPIIPGQMQARASDPAYCYSASSPAEIQTAVANLLRAAVTKVARLSQWRGRAGRTGRKSKVAEFAKNLQPIAPVDIDAGPLDRLFVAVRHSLRIRIKRRHLFDTRFIPLRPGHSLVRAGEVVRPALGVTGAVKTFHRGAENRFATRRAIAERKTLGKEFI